MSPRFSIIPAGAVTDPRIEARDLQVLCLLGRHIDDLGWCRRSQVRMAKELGCARSTVQASLERLILAEWVEKRVEPKGPKGDTAHSYRVRLDHNEGDSFYRDVAKIGRGRKRGAPDSQTENETISPAGITPADQSAPPRADPDRHPLPIYGSAPVTTPVERDSRESARARESGASPERIEETWLALASAWERGAKGGPGAIGSAIKGRAALAELSDDERVAAVDAAPRYLHSLKTANKYALTIENFLRGRQFLHHPPPAKASPDDIAPVALAAFSKSLWLIMWRLVNRARSAPANEHIRRRLLDAIGWVERGATMPAEHVPPESESDELVAAEVGSERHRAWVDYAARIALPRLPRPDIAPVIYVPAELPPTLDGEYRLAVPFGVEWLGQVWWWRYWKRIAGGGWVTMKAGNNLIDPLDKARRMIGTDKTTAGPLPLASDLALMIEAEPGTRIFQSWSAWVERHGSYAMTMWDRGPIWVPGEFPPLDFGKPKIDPTPDYDALEEIGPRANGEAA